MDPDEMPQPVLPLTVQLYMIGTILTEKINAQSYWQLAQLSLIYYSTYFFWDNAQTIIKQQDFRYYLGDVVFIPVVLFSLLQIWKARKQIKRYQGASDIIAQFATGKATNLETVEAAVNEALPGIATVRFREADEEDEE